MICNTEALLMLFIDSRHFLTFGLKCFNSTIYSVKTPECCPLQVERWLLQLHFTIGSCGTLWCQRVPANHALAYREMRLRCTPPPPQSTWLCPLFQYFSNIASGWNQALTRGLVTLYFLAASSWLQIQQKSMGLCHAINNVRTHWAVPCRVSWLNLVR